MDKISRLSILILCLFCNLALAQHYEFDVQTKDAAAINLAAGTDAILLAISDNDPLSLDREDVDPRVFIQLQFNTDDAPYQWLKYTANLKITPFDDNGNPGITYETKLSIENNPLGNNYIDAVGHKIDGRYGAAIQITGYETETLTGPTISDTPDNVSLTGKFMVERYYQIDANTPPAGLNHTITTTTNSGGNTADENASIRWNEVEGALEYELEYTWVDNYSTAYLFPLAASATPLSVRDFELNNTRIITQEPSFEIPLIYASGYLIYRVRALARFLNSTSQNYYTKWTSGELSKTVVSDWANWLEVVPHENNMNWQFQSSFAEAGKKKEVVSYFDGTLRNRQTVTRINTEDNAIVGEVIYDNQGRPAIEILPVPTYTDDALKYYPGFNVNSDGQIYSHYDFDWSDSTANDCEVLVDSMASTNGASAYYGPKTTSTNSFQDYVPDAQKFPFSHIEYTPDNTGRVSRKGGLGPNYQLGTDHEMKYYYTVPTQEELNRLFGYRVGNVQHYKKNMAVDPNGQVSINYIDPQGRIIASSLVGDNPENLQGLEDEENFKLHGNITSDLLNKVNENDTDTDEDNNDKYSTGRFGVLNDGLRVSRQVSVATDATTLDFDYSVALNSSFSPEYCPNEVYPYVFDLATSLRDDCATPIIDPPTVQIGTESTAGTSIPIDAAFTRSSGPLPIGTYSLYKDLKINEQVLNNYGEDYRDKLTDSLSDCYFDPSLFEPNADLSICDNIDCGDCVDSLGTKINYVVNALILFYDNDSFSGTLNGEGDVEVTYVDQTDDFNGIENIDPAELELLVERFNREWDLLIDACLASCQSYVSSCTLSSALLLQDVSPQGQYGNIEMELIDDSLVITDPLSVFNENNILYDVLNNSGSDNNWRHPSPAYTDAFGNPSEIVVTPNNEGGFTPAVITGAPIMTGVNADGSNYQYITPQNLANVADFLSPYWTPNWANSLLLYHPESCYLTYAQALCDLTANVSVYNPATNDSSNQDLDADGFDGYIQSLLSYEDALAGNANLLVSSPTAILNADPYFSILPTETGTLLGYREALMNEALGTQYEDFESSTGSAYTLLQFAYALAVCNGISDCNPPAMGTIINQLNDTGSSLTLEQKNKIWNTYKTNYLSLKEKIKYVFINIYAKENGCYNGCIGGDESTSITTVIDNYPVTSDIVNHINGITANQFCDHPEAEAYAEKEKRFLPIDELYDSGMDPGDVLSDLEGDNDYIVWIQTGKCPLLFDLDIFLKGYFTDTDGSGAFYHPVSTRLYTGQYFTPDLFTAFGGDVNSPPASIDLIGTSPSGSALILNASGVNSDPLHITAPGYNWSNYSTNTPTGSGWQIIGISQLYYDTYDAATQQFYFQFVAQILLHGGAFEEVVFSGNTIAAIGECGLDDDGVGDVLDDQVSDPSSPYGCTIQAKFKRDFIALLNALKANSALESTVNLNSYPEYTNSFLPEFLEDTEPTTTTWSHSGGIYSINNTPTNLQFDPPVSLSDPTILAFESLHYEEPSAGNDIVKLYYTRNDGTLQFFNNAKFLGGLDYSCCENKYFELVFFLMKQTDDGCQNSNGDSRLAWTNVMFVPNKQYLLNEGIDFDFHVDYAPGFGRNMSDYTPVININGEVFSFANNNLDFEVKDYCGRFGNSHFPEQNKLSWTLSTDYGAFFKMFNFSYEADGTFSRTFDFEEGMSNVAYSTDNQIAMTLLGGGEWVIDPVYGTGIQLDNPHHTRWYDNDLEFVFEDGGSLGATGLIRFTEINLNYEIYQDPGANIFQLDSEHPTNNDLLYSLRLDSRNVPDEACTPCIPPTIVPVSCTQKYADFLTYMNFDASNNSQWVDGYALPEFLSQDNFCDFNYAYLVDSYQEYLATPAFGITGAAGTGTSSNYFLSIAEFGNTLLNYGYNDISSVITAYSIHIIGHPDALWTEYVNDIYIIENDVCPPPPLPPGTLIIPDPNGPCNEIIISITDTYQQDSYDNYINGLVEEFKEDYINTAISLVVENLAMTYFDKEYQYTLYYYDQSGNLSQTVAPDGVARLDANDVILNDNINQYREDEQPTGEDPSLLPNHTFKTLYQYNSLNQLTWQQTPDGGQSWFAYDDLGRLIASQNANQNTDYINDVSKEFFTYTRYDEVGRAIEVGEFRTPSPYYEISEEGRLLYSFGGPAELVNSFDFTKGSRSQVTQTYYDQPVRLPFSVTGNTTTTSETLFSTYSPFNSRNQVTGIIYIENYNSFTTQHGGEFDHGIFYNYDIHGNVKELVNYFQTLYLSTATEDLHIKTIHYDYDLINGNVNQVIYQKDKIDQFIHRYTYDADNRITDVATSNSGLIWETEAVYDYYHHGPLARVLIGDKKVQGLDYVYTLQGWLKSVNAEDLTNINDDPGNDGAAILGTPFRTAKDALGFSLSYYEGDYLATYPTAFNAINISNNPSVPTSSKDLYNGNIKQMVTALRELDDVLKPTQVNVYEYDQMNRIKDMASSSVVNTGGGSVSVSPSYGSTYSFDRNGNLQQLLRTVFDANNDNGGAPIPMDKLEYSYETGNNQLHIVKDNINEKNQIVDYVTDLKDQHQKLYDFFGTTYTPSNTATHNYVYDNIGQLIKDRTEGLEISWGVNGKVKKVHKTPLGSRTDQILEFEYDGLGRRIAKKVSNSVGPDELTTYYVRDVQGNVLAVYEAQTNRRNLLSGKFSLKENNLYGNSRLGIEQKEQVIFDSENPEISFDPLKKNVGDKRFELSNHLGNVLSVVSDNKIPATSFGGNLSHFNAEVKSYKDYYPFGMLQPNRQAFTSGYRYGFQGQEMDNEISGEGNSYTAEFWQYDSRTARRWNPDIIVKTHESPYATLANNPIWFSDRLGADTTKAQHLAPVINRMNDLTGELEALGERIKAYEEFFIEVEKMLDDHTAWEIGLSIAHPIGGVVMQLDYELSGIDAQIEKREAEYQILQEEFQVLYNEYGNLKGYLKWSLGKNDVIRLDDGGSPILGTKNSASMGAVLLVALHKNSNTSLGNYAIYEFEIDGQTYKYGVADADRVTKRNIDVKRPNGTTTTIPSGTPVRIYQQQRAALKLFDNVDIKYEVHQNITKLNIKQIEDTKVWDYFKKNGWIPDGNTAHERKWRKKGAKRKGKLPKRLK